MHVTKKSDDRSHLRLLLDVPSAALLPAKLLPEADSPPQEEGRSPDPDVQRLHARLAGADVAGLVDGAAVGVVSARHGEQVNFAEDWDR